MAWSGTCRSTFAVPGFLVTLLGGVAAAFLLPAVGIVIALVSVVFLAFVAITVEVDDDQFQVRYSGPLGWPRTTVPLVEVESVEVIDVEPMRYGGWGYRGSLALFKRAAINLRKGPGLRLALTRGRVLIVTVDDAEGAFDAIGSRLSSGGAGTPGS